MKIEHDSSVDDGVRMVSLCEKHSRETHGTNDNSIVSSGCTEKVTKCEEPVCLIIKMLMKAKLRKYAVLLAFSAFVILVLNINSAIVHCGECIISDEAFDFVRF